MSAAPGRPGVGGRCEPVVNGEPIGYMVQYWNIYANDWMDASHSLLQDREHALRFADNLNARGKTCWRVVERLDRVIS